MCLPPLGSPAARARMACGKLSTSYPSVSRESVRPVVLVYCPSRRGRAAQSAQVAPFYARRIAQQTKLHARDQGNARERTFWQCMGSTRTARGSRGGVSPVRERVASQIRRSRERRATQAATAETARGHAQTGEANSLCSVRGRDRGLRTSRMLTQALKLEASEAD